MVGGDKEEEEGGLRGGEVFYFFRGRSQLQHEVIKTGYKRKPPYNGQKQRTKNKETGEGKQRNLN